MYVFDKNNSFTNIFCVFWYSNENLFWSYHNKFCGKKIKMRWYRIWCWSNEQVVWFFNCYDFTRFLNFFFLLGRSYSHKSQFLVFAQNPVGLSQGVTISASLIIGMKQGGINSLCFLPEKNKTSHPDKAIFTMSLRNSKVFLLLNWNDNEKFWWTFRV